MKSSKDASLLSLSISAFRYLKMITARDNRTTVTLGLKARSFFPLMHRTRSVVNENAFQAILYNELDESKHIKV